jgi:mRNA interferase MazF
MVMKRGEVWWATLPEPAGSMPGYRRPVLIIQSNAFTASAIHTVAVLAITSNLRLANAPGNVLINPGQSGLPRDSVINVSQILTIDKTALTERVGALPGRVMRAVEEGMRFVLGL